MLALLGYCMVAVFMALIMTKRMSALLALIIVPIIFMLATLALLSIGVMNMTPWGGPTARVISSLQLTTEEVFLPLIPVMAAGILFAFLAAWYFGIKERKRIGIRQMDDSAIRELQAAEEQVAAAASRETLTDLQRPKLNWVNAGLTIALLIALIAGLLPLPVLFMLGFAIAAMINYPNLVQQKERVAAHAGNVLAVVALVFASGIFTGIMNGTEMVDAMATALVQVIPDQLGSQLPLITAITSMPFTYFMANDPYYYGIIPIIGETAASYNIPMAEIARASVLGQPAHVLSPLYAAGYLLVGMIGIDYGQNQRFALKWAVASSLFMIMAAISFGVISI